MSIFPNFVCTLLRIALRLFIPWYRIESSMQYVSCCVILRAKYNEMSKDVESIDCVRNPSTGCLIYNNCRPYQTWRRNHPDAPVLQGYYVVPVLREAPNISSLGIDCTCLTRSAPPSFTGWNKSKYIVSLLHMSPVKYQRPKIYHHSHSTFATLITWIRIRFLSELSVLTCFPCVWIRKLHP